MFVSRNAYKDIWCHRRDGQLYYSTVCLHYFVYDVRAVKGVNMPLKSVLPLQYVQGSVRAALHYRMTHLTV